MKENEVNMEPNEACEDDLHEAGNENIDEMLQEKERDIEDLNNQLLRLQADFVNFRKRVEKEK